MRPDDAQLTYRVQQLLARYTSCIDEDTLEDWPRFFTEDGIYRITSRQSQARGLAAGFWYCRGRGMLSDRINALRRASIYEPHYYRHLLSGTHPVGQEAAGWRFHTNFQVVRTMHTGEMSVFAAGLFDDWIVEDGGALLFREKNVICDSSRIDTLLVLPL